MQDAGKQRPYYGRALGAWGHVAGKSTLVSMQDAGKQRPYYGRGLGAWGHVPRKSTRILPDGWGMEPGQGPSAHPSTQAGSHRIYVKHVQTTPTTVHSRDAPCVRPACLRSQYACLSNRVHACAPNMHVYRTVCVLALACLSNRVHACAPNMHVYRTVCMLALPICMFIEPCACLRLHVYRTVCVLALPICMFIEPCACLRLHVYRTVCVLALACLSNRVRPAYHASQHTGTLPGDVRPVGLRSQCAGLSKRVCPVANMRGCVLLACPRPASYVSKWAWLSADPRLPSPYLRLHQHNLYLIRQRGGGGGGERDLLHAQVVDQFAVAVEMHRDRRPVEGNDKRDSCADGAGVAGPQGVAVLLAAQPGRRAIVFHLVIQAQDRHRPHALARSQIDIGQPAIRPHRRFANTRLLHFVASGLDKEAGAVNDDLTVLADRRHR